MQVPSQQRNSPAPQAVSRRAPTRCHQAGSSLRGPGRPRPGLPAQSACPAPSYSALNQTPWGLGTKDQQGWVGGRLGGGPRPGTGRTHCCRGSHQNRPRSRLLRCTTACWTHSAHCCTGGKSSCSGVYLQSGEQATVSSSHRGGAASDERSCVCSLDKLEALLWDGMGLDSFSRRGCGGAAFAPLTPTPHPAAG